MSEVMNGTGDDRVMFKAFDSNMECRGYEFKAGETYTLEGEVEVFEGGFHACYTPLAVLDSYPPTKGTRYAKITASGGWSECGERAANRQITVNEELGEAGLVRAAVDVAHGRGLLMHSVQDRDNCASVTPSDFGFAAASGARSAALATGSYSLAAAHGCSSAALADRMDSLAVARGAHSIALSHEIRSMSVVKGDYSLARAKGECGVSAVLGDQSEAVAEGGASVAAVNGSGSRARARQMCSVAASNGPFSSAAADCRDSIAAANDGHVLASCLGDNSVAVARGGESVAQCAGDRSCALALGRMCVARASGDASAAVVSGPLSQAVAECADSIAFAFGAGSIASGALGSYLVLAEVESDGRHSLRVLGVRAVRVDGEAIKPGQPYQLKGGEVVAVNQTVA